MGRPIIGITGELEAARWGNWIREGVVSPVTYTRAVERAGGTPVVLPPVPLDSVPTLIAGMDALLFSGGKDLDPGLYDEQRLDETDVPDHRRDRFELALIRAAIEAELPFLAIGRGLHVLCVARDGTLIQHLPAKVGHNEHRPDPVKMAQHEVRLSESSQLGRMLGTTATVPAAHHQAIGRMGSGLLAVAWAEQDQIVEAVELQGHRFGIGVQWHPEEGDDTRLLKALVTAAVSRSGQPRRETSRQESRKQQKAPKQRTAARLARGRAGHGGSQRQVVAAAPVIL